MTKISSDPKVELVVSYLPGCYSTHWVLAGGKPTPMSQVHISLNYYSTTHKLCLETHQPFFEQRMFQTKLHILWYDYNKKFSKQWRKLFKGRETPDKIKNLSFKRLRVKYIITCKGIKAVVIGSNLFYVKCRVALKNLQNAMAVFYKVRPNKAISTTFKKSITFKKHGK